MKDEAFRQTMYEIVAALQKAGYNPYDQLTGFLQTGNARYITRRDGARERIVALDKGMIRDYLKTTNRSLDVRSFHIPTEMAMGA